MKSDFEAGVLFDLAQQVQAYKLLHDPQVGGTATPDQLLDLCKRAGYPEESAQKAASQRANERLDHGLPLFQSVYVHQ